MTLEDVTKFWEWFDKTRDDLAIRQVEKRARCPRGRIGNAYSARKEPTPLVCDSIAAGLGIDKSKVLELAGIVPPSPPPVSEEEEAGQILRRLPANVRVAVMTMLHGLAEPHTLYEEDNHEHRDRTG